MMRKLISIFTAIVLLAGCLSAGALGMGGYAYDEIAPQSESPDPLEITTPSNLPSKPVGYNYSYKLSANYSDAKFSLAAGSSISQIGLSLNNNRLTGTLIAEGTFKFTVVATSAQAGQSVEKELTLVVTAGANPTDSPTAAPTATPTASPTATPTASPTATPTPSPTATPTASPSTSPSHLRILTPDKLPERNVGYNYSYRLTANYSDAVFSLKAGSSLDNTGLTLNNNYLKGTLQTEGTYKFTVVATSAQAGESVEKELTLVILPAGTTPSPTPKPTNTPKPTATPAVTQTPAVTETPSVTETPIVTPDPGVVIKPGTFWTSAADTVQYVRLNSPFEIRLIEGLSARVVYSGVTGDLPNGVRIVTGDAEPRYVAVAGTLESATRSQGATVVFSIDLIVDNEAGMSLSFVLLGRRGQEAPIDEYPAGRPLVPFGGAREAILPSAFRRKEDDAV